MLSCPRQVLTLRATKSTIKDSSQVEYQLVTATSETKDMHTRLQRTARLPCQVTKRHPTLRADAERSSFQRLQRPKLQMPDVHCSKPCLSWRDAVDFFWEAHLCIISLGCIWVWPMCQQSLKQTAWMVSCLQTPGT